MDYADLTEDTEEYELPRQCPICGQWEPVSVEVLDRAREQLLPDVWVCCECWLKKEVALSDAPPRPAGGEGGVG